MAEAEAVLGLTEEGDDGRPALGRIDAADRDDGRPSLGRTDAADRHDAVSTKSFFLCPGYFGERQFPFSLPGSVRVPFDAPSVLFV